MQRLHRVVAYTLGPTW